MQQQLGRCTEEAQEMDQSYFPQGLTDIKPTLFHGYENENLEQWTEKLPLHLERRSIDIKAALAELALHLAGPVESFFPSLSASDKDDFEKLYIMLRERFFSKDRVWRMRQKLTARKQGSNEPLDRYIEDLQHMFELTEEEKP